MSKEKTEYRFSVHAAPAVINQVIQNYLAANQYEHWASGWIVLTYPDMCLSDRSLSDFWHS